MPERDLFNEGRAWGGTSDLRWGMRFYICKKSWKHLNCIRQRVAVICAKARSRV
jgi:hypothetical protein